MTELKLYFENKITWFQDLRLSSQLSLIGATAITISLTVYLCIWASSPSYGVLFNHLNAQDASPILTELERANIPYQVQNQGQDILIDKRLINKTRIKLMGSEMHLTHNVGFELFDKSDFGMTDFSQKINYQRALQGELERTISSLDEVKAARVQLTIPESHLFQQDTNAPRAAVALHLNHPLTPQQVKSIQQLITASVANLSSKNVIIVDQNGNGLIANENDASTGHFAAKEKVERYLSEKVMQILRPIFVDDNIMVKIDATLNYDQLERERIKPQRDAALTHEKETRHRTNTKSNKTPSNEEISREKSYQLGQEKEHFTRANGTIERLTISVVLPKNTPKTTLIQIERLVKSVIGFNPHRGDLISVEALSAAPQTWIDDKTPTPPPLNLSPQQSYIFLAGLISILMLIGASNFYRRLKQRKRLLKELSQWLSENE